MTEPAPARGFGRRYLRLLRAAHALNTAHGSTVGGAEMKAVVESFYDGLAERSPGERAWNWGLGDAASLAALDAARRQAISPGSDGLSEQLYLRTLEGAGLLSGSALRVIEVGCGAGFGLGFLARSFPQARFLGIDLSGAAIAAAQARHNAPNLTFARGDAEAIPANDASADIILNVESSHNYPDLGRFFLEVTRVLRIGGFLAHSDFFTASRRVAFLAAVSHASRLELEIDEDISEAVCAAIRLRLAEAAKAPPVRGLRARLAQALVNRARVAVMGEGFLPERRAARNPFDPLLWIAPRTPVECYRRHLARRI